MIFLARIKFFGEKQGGRISPPKPGFRPQLKIDTSYTSCFINSPDDKISAFDFDKDFVVRLELMFPEEYQNKLFQGDSVNFYEGNKKIAEGIIIKQLS